MLINSVLSHKRHPVCYRFSQSRGTRQSLSRLHLPEVPVLTEIECVLDYKTTLEELLSSFFRGADCLSWRHRSCCCL